jgi:HD-like signal output (HDOD) protein
MLVECKGPSGPALPVLAASIAQISLLPEVTPRLLRVASDPWSEAADLRGVIERDPVLGLHVLHVLNSTSYGLRTSVADLDAAISLLGLVRVRDVSITVAISELFRGRGKYLGYDRPGLWRHLVAVAVCSRLLSVRLPGGGQANAFLAGLLHDIGIILLDLYRHAEFHRVLASMSTSKPLVAFERRVLPWDHTEVGEAVAERWRVPDFARAVIRWHHDPASCPAPHEPLAHCVAVANAVCSLKGYTSVGENLVRLPIRSLRRMRLGVRDVRVLADQLGAEMSRNQALLELLDR